MRWQENLKREERNLRRIIEKGNREKREGNGTLRGGKINGGNTDHHVTRSSLGLLTTEENVAAIRHARRK